MSLSPEFRNSVFSLLYIIFYLGLSARFTLMLYLLLSCRSGNTGICSFSPALKFSDVEGFEFEGDPDF
jgi:hypothetical protein